MDAAGSFHLPAPTLINQTKINRLPPNIDTILRSDCQASVFDSACGIVTSGYGHKQLATCF